MPDYVYADLEKSPHSTVGVLVSGNGFGWKDTITSNDDLTDNIDRSSGSKYFLEPGCPKWNRLVTYHVLVKSLWADEPYDLEIDTRSIKLLPGRQVVDIRFRLV